MKRAAVFAATLAAMVLASAAAQETPTPPPPTEDPDDDGGRIVGGSRAGPDNPWQIEIFSTAQWTPAELEADRLKGAKGFFLTGQKPYQIAHKCGGVYIGDNWILTAAHCLIEVAGNPLEVRRIRMGTLNLSIPGSIYKIERAVIHDGYDASKGGPPRNDIALIRVSGNVVAKKIDLFGDRPTDPPVAPGDKLRVTGWGFRNPVVEGVRSAVANPASPELYQVILTPTVKGCEVPEGYGAKMICAGPLKVGEDSCNGDSGGPMTRSAGSTRRVLVGLVSWGRGCGQNGKPGIYTAVGGYRDWIAKAKAKSQPGKIARIP